MSNRPNVSRRPARAVLAAMVSAFLGAAIGIAPDASVEAARPKSSGVPHKHRRGAKAHRPATPPAAGVRRPLTAREARLSPRGRA